MQDIILCSKIISDHDKAREESSLRYLIQPGDKPTTSMPGPPPPGDKPTRSMAGPLKYPDISLFPIQDDETILWIALGQEHYPKLMGQAHYN